MIELTGITVERETLSCFSIAYSDVKIELRVPHSLDTMEFCKEVQRIIDMENRGHGKEFEFSSAMRKCARYIIHKIYHNEEKGTTVVCFDNSVLIPFGMDTEEESEKQKIKVKRDSKDRNDIYMAVASAVMIRKYKSNSQFKAHICRSIPEEFDGRPDIYQIMAAAEVSDIYGSWEKFCKIVDEKLELSKSSRHELKLGKKIDKLRRNGVREKDIVTKLGLKGVTELRRLRALSVELNSRR